MRDYLIKMYYIKFSVPEAFLEETSADTPKPKYLKANLLKSLWEKTEGLNRIAKIDYGHL